MPDTVTIHDAKRSYVDNADYAEVPDVTVGITKARAFVTACRRLLFLSPRRTGSRDEGDIETASEVLQREMRHAEAWLAARVVLTPLAVENRVTRASFRRFRD